MAIPDLSVVMPVRNAVKTVGAALLSGLNQSFRNFDFIVVDDGSTDGSREVVEKIAREDRRVMLAETGAGARGIVAAHQVGMARARGEFLARMDADDVSRPERFERQMAFLTEQPEVAVCGCGVAVGRREGGEVTKGYQVYEEWLNGLKDPQRVAAERFVESPVAHAGAMMRRAALEEVGGYRDVAWAEDYDLWLRMFERGFALANHEEVLLEWWDSEGRMTRCDGRYSQERFLEAKAHYLARLEVVRRGKVVVSGAGPIGKRLATLLRAKGVAVEAFLDVHPRRIGERIGGIPVRAVDGLPEPGEAVVLGAVGVPGGREKVRAVVTEGGFVEGVDFFCVA